jgi:DNA-binding NtrC family response regulator
MDRVSELPVLLVDDEPQTLERASRALQASGIAPVITESDSRSVLRRIEQEPLGVVLLDLSMPHLSGYTLLTKIAAKFPDVAVIVMTATNELETAVQCMQAGAVDYLVKPVEDSRLVSSVKRALETRPFRMQVLSDDKQLLTKSPAEREAFSQIITQDPAMFGIFRYVDSISQSPLPVLITGETGTGKELIARALHRLSRRSGELVAINVAGLDDALFSDSLFGHAKGAFTGADRCREGLVASAADGTLFLDEIGDLTVSSQVKLLRLLQDGTYYPLGADQPRQSRVRVIVATNCDVAQDAAAGNFRKDLYYRLRTHQVALPPLRRRSGDVPLLLNHFVEKAASVLGKNPPAVPGAVHALLRTHDFPGNIRELEAMTFDAVARHQSGALPLQSFKEVIAARPASELPNEAVQVFPERLPTLSETENALMEEALTRAEGNQGIAACMLGISRQALNKRLRRRQ